MENFGKVSHMPFSNQVNLIQYVFEKNSLLPSFKKITLKYSTYFIKIPQ